MSSWIRARDRDGELECMDAAARLGDFVLDPIVDFACIIASPSLRVGPGIEKRTLLGRFFGAFARQPLRSQWSRKSGLFFIVHDFTNSKPLAALASDVHKYVEPIWDGLAKAAGVTDLRLADCFDLTFVALPHQIYAHTEFSAATEMLRLSLLLDPRPPKRNMFHPHHSTELTKTSTPSHQTRVVAKKDLAAFLTQVSPPPPRRERGGFKVLGGVAQGLCSDLMRFGLAVACAVFGQGGRFDDYPEYLPAHPQRRGAWGASSLFVTGRDLEPPVKVPNQRTSLTPPALLNLPQIKKTVLTPRSGTLTPEELVRKDIDADFLPPPQLNAFFPPAIAEGRDLELRIIELTEETPKLLTLVEETERVLGDLHSQATTINAATGAAERRLVEASGRATRISQTLTCRTAELKSTSTAAALNIKTMLASSPVDPRISDLVHAVLNTLAEIDRVYADAARKRMVADREAIARIEAIDGAPSRIGGRHGVAAKEGCSEDGLSGVGLFFLWFRELRG
ncbi:hypothetical protein BDK51DRAFT_41433 [Blyttiomyces helicus]|uniref:Uncharacterized protein n=1 Tax=Blyttiomyces helicus TaxID=388810 RepID=A0A4P9W1A0_9FUNG|nr:hypothetical protein BDK51DRAFT_41433 [Blyttiomyces helicus]|eukprot:RKO85422.1 hypothetical protein BDK51DRAFT_41433 [Blyttiomyces helicus]